MLAEAAGISKIIIACGYTDMRKSIDGLCAIIMSQLQEEPSFHSIYFFCGKCCDRIKVLLREPLSAHLALTLLCQNGYSI